MWSKKKFKKLLNEKNHIKKVFPCINIERFYIRIYKNIIFETILKTFTLKQFTREKGQWNAE